MLNAIREVQIPLLAAMLLGACAAKLVRVLRTGSVEAGIGPTALFPMRLRRPLAVLMSAVEGGLGLGLIVTAGRFGAGTPATCIRLGSGLLFLVAMSALTELRMTRPDLGCGCFGDFSTAPVSGRAIVRSALLAAGSLATIGLRPIQLPRSGSAVVQLLGTLAVGLALIAALSPEVGEGLVRFGYSEPCELRDVPSARTLSALRRSKQWRKYADLVTSEVPADIWRELCWRYVVYPGSCDGRPAELVFAVFLRQRRPAIQAALVDAGTGLPLSWPAAQARPGGRGLRSLRRLALRLPPRLPAGPPPVQPDLPFSTDVYAER